MQVRAAGLARAVAALVLPHPTSLHTHTGPTTRTASRPRTSHPFPPPPPASSNRGLCDSTTGLCTCATGFLPSNGLGGAGTINDCGYVPLNVGGSPVTPIGACPGTLVACSGHGTCDR